MSASNFRPKYEFTKFEAKPSLWVALVKRQSRGFPNSKYFTSEFLDSSSLLLQDGMNYQ